MCLASEAGKKDEIVSQPEDSSSSTSIHPTSMKPQIKEKRQDTDIHPPSTHPSAIFPSLPFITSTSTDAIPSPNSCQSTHVKKSNKKAKQDESNDDEIPCSECNVDSVFSTIDAVARGAWIDMKDIPKKKTHSSLTDGKSCLFKKKSNTKAKTLVKEKKEELDDNNRLHGFSDEETKGVFDINPDTETANIKSTDFQGYIPELIQSPVTFKEEEKERNKGERSSDTVSEVNTENRGSRKSERSCKGALYKTLVSEGMLTSLRASIDRGKRGAFRTFDHDTNWSHESFAVSHVGLNNPKKLKKTKSKDEPSQGLGKLEEEFERKFNSLPQYSPLTFDKKGTAVTKKRKTDSSTNLENTAKSAKGMQSIKVVQSDSTILDSPSKVKPCAGVGQMLPDVQSSTNMDMLVGSQKRKARKTKITHLVRTADGAVSPVAEDKTRDPNQEQEKKPITQQNLCSETRCYRSPRAEEAERNTGPQELPAFFSLAALAEVAAMENVHRGQRSLAQAQKKDLAQTPVLISCADQ